MHVHSVNSCAFFFVDCYLWFSFLVIFFSYAMWIYEWIIYSLIFVLCRHLDNLLLRDDGRLFHVDFGFILGRDPKPFPPPMKLCKEMVEAMGGAERY